MVSYILTKYQKIQVVISTGKQKIDLKILSISILQQKKLVMWKVLMKSKRVFVCLNQLDIIQQKHRTLNLKNYLPAG